MDDLPGVAAIVRFQVLDVFEEKHRRAFCFDDCREAEEEIALRFALKAMGHAEALALGNSGDGEGLAGEAGGEDVVFGNRGDVEFADVGMRRVTVPGLVSFLREFVPFAGEEAFTSELFEGAAEAADAGEEVDEGEGQILSLLNWLPVNDDARRYERKDEDQGCQYHEKHPDRAEYGGRGI